MAPAVSGRGALAKVTALRTLEKMERPVDDGSYPVDDDGRFFAGPPEAWDLYRRDSDETRERWRENWQRQQKALEAVARVTVALRSVDRLVLQSCPQTGRPLTVRLNGTLD